MVRILAKITLLDEIVGLAYWGGGIFGLFLIFEHIHRLFTLIVVLPIAYEKLSNIFQAAIGE